MAGWQTHVAEMDGVELEGDLLAGLFGDGAKDALDTLLQLLCQDDEILAPT